MHIVSTYKQVGISWWSMSNYDQ